MKTIIISSTMGCIHISLLLFLLSYSTKAQTWEFVGLDSMLINQIYVSGDTIYSGTSVSNGSNQIAGLYFSSNAGYNWFQIDSALGNNNVYGFQLLSPETLFILKAGILYKTTDHGEMWDTIDNISNNPISGFKISPFNASEMYSIDLGFAGGTFNNLYKSTDSGENWGILGPFPSSSHGNSLIFSFDLTDSLNLYVTVDDHWNSLYFFKSTDKGENWNFISSPPVWPKAILSDCFISNRLYLVSGPYSSNGGGVSWTLEDSGLTDTSYSISLYQNKLLANSIYHLRSDGIYYSINDTLFWNLMKESNNLPIDYKDIRTMCIEPIEKILFLGTRRGIYRTSITTDVKTQKINESGFVLSQNYPNPFNPSTIISFYIPQRSFITLKVFDLLGKEIITLVSEDKVQGEYKTEFKGNSLTSGIYFYILTAMTQTGERIREGKKMILIK